MNKSIFLAVLLLCPSAFAAGSDCEAKLDAEFARVVGENSAELKTFTEKLRSEYVKRAEYLSSAINGLLKQPDAIFEAAKQWDMDMHERVSEKNIALAKALPVPSDFFFDTCGASSMCFAGETRWLRFFDYNLEKHERQKGKTNLRLYWYHDNADPMVAVQATVELAKLKKSPGLMLSAKNILDESDYESKVLWAQEIFIRDFISKSLKEECFKPRSNYDDSFDYKIIDRLRSLQK